MNIEKHMTEDAVLKELGKRLTRRRLDLGITQAETAMRAGLSKRTLERIEAGEDTRVSSLLRLLRVLELTDGLNGLAPDSGPRPMELLKLRGRERRRVSSRRPDESGSWQWGEDQ